ncbi:cysteine protease domain, YopT-type [Legionella beliardensis]|uniref:Cysteine protease domain, YopT-type n=1 Tax=Legionella beliardensis TaxID=91822 RepID=A0A378I221_9GAMM|nr:YopT-type cysteine protease domain-containing protein [Legionella beliardensis]STX29237.1 cysteine protease domain, YopT-type [Legionella beliardensis]
MKSYKCLDFLEKKGIDFIYTPFDQGATTNILDPDWKGSCNALSHEWMLRKMFVADMREPATYEITEPHLPHPVIIGDNEASPEKIHKDLKKFYKYASTEQYLIDKHVPSLEAKADKLLNYIESQQFHSGIIEANIYIKDKNRGGLPQNFGHAVSFVKRGNAISWFDPNYGEITFSNFKDFRVWFKQEVKEGALNYLFSMADHEHEQTYQTLADVFPQPKFTDEQKQIDNPLVQKIIARREKEQEIRSQIKDFFIYDYTIKTYSSPRYITEKEASRSCMEAFQAEHRRLFTKDKDGFFSKWYKTELKNDWELSDYLKHAKENNNRSREAFVNLNWMNKDGTLTENAPEEILEAYFSMDDPLQLKQ